MKDYYEILGLDEEASQEEIRERWLELSKLYHPDVLKSPEADERIKEINEAYQVLKDYSSRLEYDLQRALQKSVLRKIEEKEAKKFPWPKVIWPAGVLIAVALIIFYIVFKTPPPEELTLKKPTPKQDKIREIIPPPVPAPVQVAELEKGKPLEKPTPIKPAPSREEVKPLPPEKKLVTAKTQPEKIEEKKVALAKGAKEDKKDLEKVIKVTPLKSPAPAKITPLDKPQIQEKKREPLLKPAELEKPKEVEKPAPLELAKVAPPPSPPAPESKELEAPEKPKEIIKAPSEVEKGLTPQVSELKPEEKIAKMEKAPPPAPPAEIVKEIKPEEPAKVIPLEKPQIIEAKKPEKAEIPEKILPTKEEEVKRFIAGYVSKYKQKDIEGFLAHFSPQAIQNQKHNFAAIKKIYSNFFERSQELNYILQDVQTADHPQGLEVKAKYELHQVAKKDGEKKSWRGQIRWILVKENDQLKIISLDYQHQK